MLSADAARQDRLAEQGRQAYRSLAPQPQGLTGESVIAGLDCRYGLFLPRDHPACELPEFVLDIFPLDFHLEEQSLERACALLVTAETPSGLCWRGGRATRAALTASVTAVIESSSFSD